MQQVHGRLVNVHVVAELAQQQYQARAVLHDRARVVRQQVQAIGRAGEQEVVQGVVTRFGVETDPLEILFKDIQIVLCHAA